MKANLFGNGFQEITGKIATDDSGTFINHLHPNKALSHDMISKTV